MFVSQLNVESHSHHGQILTKAPNRNKLNAPNIHNEQVYQGKIFHDEYDPCASLRGEKQKTRTLRMTPFHIN